MSDLQFENQGIDSVSRFQSRTVLGSPETPKMVKAMMKTGVVKNEATAGKILLILSTIMFLLAIGIFCYFVLGIGRGAPSASVNQTNSSFEQLPPALRAHLTGNGQ